MANTKEKLLDWRSEEGKKGNGRRYTALKTSNKINVVSGDSIRKTHRTISHTILRQNGQDSYLLHGRPFPPSYNRLPSYPLARPLPLSDLSRFLYLKSTRERGHAIIPADVDEPRTFPFPRGANRGSINNREGKRLTGRKRSAVSVAFTRFRYVNQTFLYREPRINYSLDTYTGILYSIIGA